LFLSELFPLEISSSLLKNREIWGSSALVLNLAVMIEISSPGMARGFLSVFAVFA
jgi:hypothetical protein